MRSVIIFLIICLFPLWAHAQPIIFGPSNTKIKGAKICYKVTTSSPGTTYMLARLSEALTNGTGTVIHDDPAVLSNTVFECHTTTVPPPGAKLNGPLVLSLWMVFGSSSDKIHIGRIEVF